jgi:hypothetical protein
MEVPPGALACILQHREHQGNKKSTSLSEHTNHLTLTALMLCGARHVVSAGLKCKIYA